MTIACYSIYSIRLMSYCEKKLLQILEYSVTPYITDYQRFTKTVFISPGPPTFSYTLRIYITFSTVYE